MMLAAAVAAGCSAGHAETFSTPLQPAGSAPAAATRAAVRYLHALAARQPAAALAAPETAAQRRSLGALTRWLGAIPVAHLRVVAVPISTRPPDAASLLVSLRARLGRGAASTYVSLGQRRILVRRRAGAWRVAADLSARPGSGVAPGGLAAVPRASYAAGANAVVVNAARASPGEVSQVRAAARTLPRLVARYGPPGGVRTPVIVLVPGWGRAESIAGISFPHEATAAEYHGLVFVDVPEWRRWGDVRGRGVVVHELTHVASGRLLRGAPLSLLEGLARYEEEGYDRRAGAPTSVALLAAAYRRGYPTIDRWGWALRNGWQLHGRVRVEVAYEDAAAVTRAVIAGDGVDGVRRLARAFRREGGGWFSHARVRAAFLTALGRPFAAVLADAHRETFAAAGR
jgi:hypothetical protein